jgi:hypothetical protein
MATKSRRTRPGDVLRLNTPKGIAHLQYIGRHPEYGDAVLVSPKLRGLPEVIGSQMFSGAYVAFYPAVAAVAEGLIEVIGHLTPPSVPRRLRRPGARSSRGIDTWVIEDGVREATKSRLTQDDRRLPIAVIWNHEFLVQRLLQGWKPAQEGVRELSGDEQVAAELAAVSDVEEPHLIAHYLYVPSRETAASIGGALRTRGFDTEERLGADGVNWLVLARHVAVPSDELIAATRRSMEALVAAVGGG